MVVQTYLSFGLKGVLRILLSVVQFRPWNISKKNLAKVCGRSINLFQKIGDYLQSVRKAYLNVDVELQKGHHKQVRENLGSKFISQRWKAEVVQRLKEGNCYWGQSASRISAWISCSRGYHRIADLK